MKALARQRPITAYSLAHSSTFWLPKRKTLRFVNIYTRFRNQRSSLLRIYDVNRTELLYHKYTHLYIYKHREKNRTENENEHPTKSSDWHMMFNVLCSSFRHRRLFRCFPLSLSLRLFSWCCFFVCVWVVHVVDICETEALHRKIGAKHKAVPIWKRNS